MARRTKKSASNGRGKDAPARRHFTDAQKAAVLRYYTKHGFTAAVRKYRLSTNTLGRWKKQVDPIVDIAKVRGMSSPWNGKIRAPVAPSIEARVLLAKAVKGLERAYRAGEPIRPGVDPYISLAFDVLSNRGA